MIYFFAALAAIRHAAGNYCTLSDDQKLTTVSFCGILLCSLRSVRWYGSEQGTFLVPTLHLCTLPQHCLFESIYIPSRHNCRAVLQRLCRLSEFIGGIKSPINVVFFAFHAPYKPLKLMLPHADWHTFALKVKVDVDLLRKDPLRRHIVDRSQAMLQWDLSEIVPVATHSLSHFTMEAHVTVLFRCAFLIVSKLQFLYCNTLNSCVNEWLSRSALGALYWNVFPYSVPFVDITC